MEGIAMKEIHLYNSKSKQLEILKPQVEGKVSIYCCGPTVYNHAHVGNVRPMVVFDNLRRLLKAV
jgi:cysteinyl-tRNA synthetase